MMGSAESGAYRLYRALWHVVKPILSAALLAAPAHRPLRARWNPPTADIPAGAIWVHACSVGEVSVARPLIAALQQQMPSAGIFLTTSTRTGTAHAASILPALPRTWCPFDHPAAVRRFFDATRPRALVLIETELWPCLLHEAHARRIPIMLANGRISTRHARRYAWAGPLVAPMVRRLQLAAMQSTADAERLARLGASTEQLAVLGNIKYDGAVFEADAATLHALQRSVRPDPSRPLIVFGSTRPGDEARASAAMARLETLQPKPQWVLALRHPERLDAVEADCAGRSTRRRSTCTETAPWEGDDMLLVDTLGELNALYALATVAVMGGSFDPAIQGHNPLEPAALGKPVIMGPCMGNFAEAAEALVAAGAAVQVQGADDLADALAALLDSAERRTAMGEAGRQVVQARQGAAAATAEALASLLEATALTGRA